MDADEADKRFEEKEDDRMPLLPSAFWSTKGGWEMTALDEEEEEEVLFEGSKARKRLTGDLTYRESSSSESC